MISIHILDSVDDKIRIASIAYNNDNNTSKDYYFVCVIGENTPVAISSEVVKVTVNPGNYKVTFHLSTKPNINPVVISCEYDNLASKKGIEHFFGEYKDMVPCNGTHLLVYEKYLD